MTVGYSNIGADRLDQNPNSPTAELSRTLRLITSITLLETSRSRKRLSRLYERMVWDLAAPLNSTELRMYT
jgi:hypothetical protein